ncbi:MAG: hypothetical protein DRJ01_09275 [Bacteroidetes bacterium]|nr:MAG: hypothetical protein DRJ01_09275 [Bacteroidota bacterium]
MIKIDTHSKRKLIYELIDVVGFLFFLSVFILAIGQKTDNAFIEKYNVIFVILFVIGFIWILIRLFVGRIKWYKPINKTGEIDFYDNYLTYKNTNIQIDQIKTIRIGVTQCKGQPAGGRSGLSDGTGNYIEIFLKDKMRLKERLLIESLQQVNDLKLLMDTWEKTGIMIIGYWKPFLHIFEK